MTCAAFLSMSLHICGADTPKLITREALTSRTHSTWEGSYAFVEEKILSIEGLPDLHVLLYQRPAKEGTLIDFAEAVSTDKLRLLRETETNVKGVTPALEGIEVFPDTNDAEIIVRWRHLGQGGLRCVEKYRYSPEGINLVASSDLVNEGRKMKWVKGGSSVPSTPAKHSPRPVTPPTK
jgi:hypothetical protein